MCSVWVWTAGASTCWNPGTEPVNGEQCLKRLLLWRHAKSSWDHPGLADHDRPLAERGRLAAPRMAAWMLAQGLLPERVLCSTACRTRQTWAALAEASPRPLDVAFDRALYMAEAGQLLDRLRGLDAGLASVMLIGHNPGLEDLARRLAGGGDALSLGRLRLKYPTAALAELALDIPAWSALDDGGGQLLRFVRPRDLD